MKGYKYIREMNCRALYLVMISIFVFAAVGAMAMSGGNVEAADASGHILVSNMEHGGTLQSTQTAYDYAQAFQTGTNPNGYDSASISQT